MRSGSRLLAVAALLVVFASSWLGCGGGGGGLTEPGRGTLQVTTETTGPEPDADGYAISFDGATPVGVGANGVVRREGVTEGEHTVELSGLAGNCTLDGPARRELTVTADAVTAAEFTVTCAATTGAIRVTTVAGDPADEDGFVLLLDGQDRGAIGAAASVVLSEIAPGPHGVGLGGLAANCAADGENPRAVQVAPGATAEVRFTVTCEPPPPAAGTLEIATATAGPEPDPDGYRFRIDGGPEQELGTGAETSIANLAAGDHAVELLGVAANCTVGGENPRTVAVPAGGTVRTEFAITCVATAGRLEVTVAGLPGGVDADVTVTGPGGFTRTVTSTRTLGDLPPGTYTVAAGEVTENGTRYAAAPASQDAPVTAGTTSSVRVTYTEVAPTLNLRIDGWYLTQSVQTEAGDIPMVMNRAAYLRVFVVANEANNARPAVRVRIYHGDDLVQTFRVPAPGSSTPTERREEPLGSSWNLRIPRELMAAGFALLADVDPDGQIAEQNEGDNVFPASGSPRSHAVHPVPVLGIRFVPVRQRANGLEGNVTDGNRSQYLEFTRRLYPLAGTDGDVHAVYTTATSNPLQPADGNRAWVDILSEIDALRIAEGTGRHYYGVVRVDYQSGLAGLGYIGVPTAIGYDLESDRGRVVAHELGHTWGRLHSPSCGATQTDPFYPYAGGRIGVYGLDMGTETLKPPTETDIMGYCGGPWISDYTYRGVKDRRALTGAARLAAPQRSLLVWGRIVDGRPELEPAFELVTRPSLPEQPGPYTVEGLADDGARIFSVAFDAPVVADDPRGTRQFAFAIPLEEAAATRLGSLRLSTPVGGTSAVRPAVPGAGVRMAPAVEARRQGAAVAVRWRADAHPMAMVRDPRTGEVLSLGRAGETEVVTDAGELEVLVSDRVGSTRLVVPVAR